MRSRMIKFVASKIAGSFLSLVVVAAALSFLASSCGVYSQAAIQNLQLAAEHVLSDYAFQQMRVVSPNTGKNPGYKILSKLVWSDKYAAYTTDAAIWWYDRLNWFASHERCIVWGTVLVNSYTNRVQFIPYGKNHYLTVTRSGYLEDVPVVSEE